MAESIVIGRRFRGPPASGNGGYSCGMVAALMGGDAAEVTLRSPPPLDRPLDAHVAADGSVTVEDRGTLVAEGRPLAGLEVELPPPVSLEAAAAARDASPLIRSHPFEECFVCGPRRPPGDGLRVISGPVAGRDDVVASPWEVDERVPSEDGVVASEIVWAALDCPSGNALLLVPEIGTSMLGRLSACLDTPLEVGGSFVTLGWPIRREGRKCETASAIFTPAGEPVARARATWIELR